MNTEEQNKTPLPLPVAAPLPLESLAPLSPAPDTGRQWEKGQYWNRLLTGDPATVPAEARQKAGVDDPSLPAEERDYRLVSAINRSWVVDHKGLSREQVRSEWPALRRRVAQELDVPDDEHELFTALSVQQADAPRREQAARAFHQQYLAALRGEPPSETEPDDAEIAAGARALGERSREQLLPLARTLAEGWESLHALEHESISLPELVQGAPVLWQAVDALAELDDDDRARVYAVARSLEPVKVLESESTRVLPAMLRSARRGMHELQHHALQGAGHIATALTRAAAETLDSDTLRGASAAADKRLQVLHELRQVAQEGVFPIRLDEECGLAGQMAVDAAGALPGAALAFMGAAGFGALTLAGTGGAVAEARKRAPEGRQELQTAAGILGGALQAGIYMGMSRIGARMLDRSINAFARAGGGGARAYSLAALQGLGTLTAENAKLLLAGKAAQATGLGLQELAARIDRVASHIDWEAFGSSFTDIEANMREAAMNLPFVLIAAGRAALHHFRAPDTVVGDGSRLAEWGVDEATRNRILDEPDLHTRSRLLQQALSSSKRWSAPGSLQDLALSLNLLNTEQQPLFRQPARVAEFLNLPPEAAVQRPVSRNKTPETPEQMLDVYEHATGRRALPPNAERSLPFALLLEEWSQRSGGLSRTTPQEQARREQYYRELNRNQSLVVPEEVNRMDFFHPGREQMVRTLMADRFSEIEALSYRALMVLNPLDSLKNSYRNADDARQAAEKVRLRIVSYLLDAFSQSVTGKKPAAEAYAEFDRRFAEIFMKRNKAASHRPYWMRRLTPGDFRGMHDLINTTAVRERAKMNPMLLECSRIMLGMRRCAESLVGLLPHSNAFQAQLSNGLSPGDAYVRLAQREMQERCDPEIWKPGPAAPGPTPENRRLRNEEILRQYRELCGHELQSSPDGKGNTLWRIMRPDGQFTYWYADPQHAVNELVGHTQLMFLPLGKPDLAGQIQQLYENKPDGPLISYRTRRGLPRATDRLTGFDNLGYAAVDDLCALWHGRVTQFGLGLEFAPDMYHWFMHRGTKLDQRLMGSGTADDRFIARRAHQYTPLHLAQTRFCVYWNRLLNSGWVPPDEAAETLLRLGLLSQEEMQGLQQLATPEAVDMQGKRRAQRIRLKRQYPGGFRPGDTIARNHVLARRLADLNLAWMLTELPESGMPRSVQQWFCMMPFCHYYDGADAPAAPPLPRRISSATSLEIARLLPLVNRLRGMRASGEQLPLAALMRGAYRPDAATRCERGWCYAVGGEGAFRGAGQSYWNLLQDPERGRSLFPPEAREELDDALRPLCGGREPAEALRELSEVLRRYPELHNYGQLDRSSSALHRLVPDPMPDTAETPLHYSRMPSTHLVRLVQPHEDFHLEPAGGLPPHLRDDARVQPALELLCALRRLTVDAPYADSRGIWWRGELYGGRKGQRPGGLPDNWKPEKGMLILLNYYRDIAMAAESQGSNGRLEVCGVPLGGIRPEELRPGALQHITIYHNREQPDQLVRLMPGKPGAANPRERVPYVVHTSDGVPLFRTMMARNPEMFPRALHGLNEYKRGRNRWYDYEITSEVRETRLDTLLADLLEQRTASAERWEAANGSNLSNLELIMQVFQDGRLPYNLLGKDPARLTRGEALTAELARLCLLAECGTDPAPHVEALVQFAAGLRESESDMKQLRLTLRRLVSPFPNQYTEEELNPDATDAGRN